MNAWISQELATVDLGDKRLDKRCQRILERCFNSPQASLCGAMRGCAEVMAASRFFDHPNVTAATLLRPHRDATLERVRTQERVLVIQDTMELDYTNQTQLQGRGPLNSETRLGFLVHTQYVVSAQRLPLGVWDTDVFARERLQEITSNHKQRDYEDKESYRWLEGYLQACALAAAAPGVEVISLSDREGDVYEVFVEHARRVAAQEPAAQFVIRCCQKERTLAAREDETEALKLAAQVNQGPVLGTIEFDITSKIQTKRVLGKNTQVFRQGRHVVQEIRACPLELKPPWRKGASLPPVSLWAVSAKEINTPDGQDPIDWLILTSLPVRNFAEAHAILDLYLARWEIEVFHKTLKSGCTIEKLQLKEEERLKPALALYMVVAWRLLYLTKLGRECPELPCDAVFEEAEWKSLVVIAKGRPALAKKPTLGELILLIAQQGGYRGCKNDGPPGPQVMWLGLRSLQHYATAWKAFGPTEDAGASPGDGPKTHPPPKPTTTPKKPTARG